MNQHEEMEKKLKNDNQSEIKQLELKGQEEKNKLVFDKKKKRLKF